MNLFKNLLVLTCIFLSTHLNALVRVQNPTIEHLNSDMKDFRHRVFAYSKCLSGNCTLQEQEKVKNAALSDGKKIVITLLTLGALGTGTILFKKYGWPKMKERLEANPEETQTKQFEQELKELDAKTKQFEQELDIRTKQNEERRKKEREPVSSSIEDIIQSGIVAGENAKAEFKKLEEEKIEYNKQQVERLEKQIQKFQEVLKNPNITPSSKKTLEKTIKNLIEHKRKHEPVSSSTD